MNDKIINQIEQVVLEVKTNYNYEKLKELEIMIDQRYGIELKDFERAKQNYQDVIDHGGKYHPDFEKSAKALALAKTKLYEKLEVKEYFSLELEIQMKLREISFAINQIFEENLEKRSCQK